MQLMVHPICVSCWVLAVLFRLYDLRQTGFIEREEVSILCSLWFYKNYCQKLNCKPFYVPEGTDF